jgi:hypothetical protein
MAAAARDHEDEEVRKMSVAENSLPRASVDRK